MRRRGGGASIRAKVGEYIFILMATKKTPGKTPEQTPNASLENKLFRLRPELIRAFDILRAEQGAHSGPRLADEAINLLLVKYGKKPV